LEKGAWFRASSSCGYHPSRPTHPYPGVPSPEIERDSYASLSGTKQRRRADISSDYGLSGFQPSGIYFAGEGCWQVTARAGNATLTFVTLVAKASTYGLELKTN
jgi:hypothetical protein